MKGPAIQLYDYQKRWMLAPARFKCAMFARQTGKTFTTTLEIVDDCFAQEAHGGRARWVILSRGERQAREAMEEGVKRHCQAYQLSVRSLEGEYRGDEGSYKQLEIALPGGSRITALPANPDTARGFSANVFLDEFAFHRDSRAIWGALFPVISKPGLKLRITSTPNGKNNKFYELISGLDDVWYRQTTDIYQAVADGLDRDIELLRTGIRDPDLWAQEYECKFIDEASAWLTFELINGCEHELAGDPELAGRGPFYIGNDIGRRKDIWVATVLEDVGDVLWERERVELRRKSFYEQDRELDRLVNRYNPVRICMDQTGMGEKPVEDAKRRYGEYRVEGIVFTNASKQVLATVGRQRFEDRRIRIPAGQDEYREDLHSLQRTTTATGAVRFEADPEATDHADRAWSLFLAMNAAETQYMPYRYEPVRPAEPATNRGRMRPPSERDAPDRRPVQITGGFNTRRGVW